MTSYIYYICVCVRACVCMFVCVHATPRYATKSPTPPLKEPYVIPKKRPTDSLATPRHATKKPYIAPKRGRCNPEKRPTRKATC